MFDFSLTELMLAGVVALVVLGPERLPKVARKAGEWVGKARSLVGGIKDELSRQAEFAELNQVKDDLREAANEVKSELSAVSDEVNKASAPWDNLPEQRTPADFGVDNNGNPLPGGSDFSGFAPLPAARSGFHTPSIHKQAMSRKRDLRPRHRPKPKLRSKR